MRPRNKEQQLLLEIVQTLPELTDKQIEYYKAKCFDTEIIESRGRLVCSDCGHAWKHKEASNMDKAKCPHCGHRANVTHNKAVDKQVRYFVIASAVKNYQILRYIQVRRRSEANKVYHWHKDVGSIVFDEKGNQTEFTLSRFTMSWYIDAWCFDSEIELRKRNDVLSRIEPTAIITLSMTPTLKRNGWDGKMLDGYATRLVELLLVNPTIESWWKIGHKGIVADALRRYSFYSNDTVRIIKLATRHGRIFRTREEWLDFKDFLGDLKYLGKDTFNPSIIFPENFEEAHRVWNERRMRKEEKERDRQRRERQIEENNRVFEQAKKEQDENKWIEHYTSHFASMDFERSGYRFKPLLSAEDFQAEYDVMKHCIKTYFGKANALLLSVSYGGEKIETAEIDLKAGVVVQCRGKNNLNTEHHDTIVYMLKQYMSIFKAYNEGKFLKYAKNKIKKQEVEQTIEDVQQVA